MADQRVQSTIRISDGSTLTQLATVDASGNQLVKISAGTAIIGALVADQTVNNTKIVGTTISVGNGTTDSGTQRVTLSSDSTGQVKLAASSGTDIGKLTANQSVNISQMNGVTTSMNTNTVDTGTQRIIQASGATGTLSNVSGSASSVTLLSSNTARLGATFFNDSAAVLYLKLNSGAASTTSYTVKLYPDQYYELPVPVYNGAITGIWSSATGTVRVTEIT